jgi:large subunit ribosomal protein L3
MAVGILGRKVGMTSVFDQQGKRVPVTVIEAGPCTITGIRQKEKDGYSAVQLGYEDIREKLVNKPVLGFFKKIKVAPKRFLCEFPGDQADSLDIGAEIRINNFKLGEYVDVRGTSIGKGFQGVVKRHNFSGGHTSHGCKTGRKPGSIGMCATPSRVFKGKKLPGQMGNKAVTIQNMKVVSVDLENNLLVVKGSVPGAENTLLTIYNSLKRGVKDKTWSAYGEDTLENWKKEAAESKAAEAKRIADAEAKKKAAAAQAAKKAATQAPGRSSKKK